jgi:hypothetical protein
VLSLDGSGAHLKLPAGMFDNLKETTIESWGAFATNTGIQRFFCYGFGDGSNSKTCISEPKPVSPDLVFGIWPKLGVTISTREAWSNRGVGVT